MTVEGRIVNGFEEVSEWIRRGKLATSKKGLNEVKKGAK